MRGRRPGLPGKGPGPTHINHGQRGGSQRGKHDQRPTPLSCGGRRPVGVRGGQLVRQVVSQITFRCYYRPRADRGQFTVDTGREMVLSESEISGASRPAFAKQSQRANQTSAYRIGDSGQRNE
jgi:hypothetical protein